MVLLGYKRHLTLIVSVGIQSAPSLLDLFKVNFWYCHVTITLFFYSFDLEEQLIYLGCDSLYFYREHGSGHAPKTYLYGINRVVEIFVSIILCFYPH